MDVTFESLNHKKWKVNFTINVSFYYYDISLSLFYLFFFTHILTCTNFFKNTYEKSKRQLIYDTQYLL